MRNRPARYTISLETGQTVAPSTRFFSAVNKQCAAQVLDRNSFELNVISSECVDEKRALSVLAHSGRCTECPSRRLKDSAKRKHHRPYKTKQPFVERVKKNGRARKWPGRPPAGQHILTLFFRWLVQDSLFRDSGTFSGRISWRNLKWENKSCNKNNEKTVLLGGIRERRPSGALHEPLPVDVTGFSRAYVHELKRAAFAPFSFFSPIPKRRPCPCAPLVPQQAISRASLK